MNITDMANISMFPAQIEVLKQAMEIAQKTDVAVMAAEEAGAIEDTVEISDYAKQLFSLEV